MPDHEDSLDGKTVDGDAKADRAEQSFGDERTRGGDTKAQSVGDESTSGDVKVDQQAFDDGMKLEDLSERYNEEGKLGKGGMGEVTLATDTRLNRKVAIKRILGEAKDKKSAVARFLTEAQSIAALSHNNIVQIYDYGRATDGHFIIMECVQGGSLQDKCKAGPIELDEAVNIFGQLCDGLAKAHAAGIIHRDIKPANILMTEDGIPKLTDFGLAKDDSAVTGPSLTGAVVGSPGYMSPEQRKGVEFTDHRSDLYSLAVTFYQMLTGKSYNVITMSLPLKLQSVVVKALEESKEDRFQSAMEMREAMLQAHSGKMDTSRSLGDGECPQCATTNASDNKHCDDCGASLKVECLSCKSSISIWKKACRECGAQQAPLVEKALSALKTIHDQAESLLDVLDFEAAADEAALMIQGEDLRLQQYASWHDEFSARLELSKNTELGRLEELVGEALAHEEAYDYKAGLQTLEQIAPSLKQTTVEVDLITTAEEVTQRLTVKQSRLKELEGIIRERVAKRKTKGLLPLVDELLTLKPDREDVQKLKAQLMKREKLLTFLKNGDYESALSLDPNSSKALVMKKNADIKAALASYDYWTALSLDPNNYLALSMKKTDDIQAALACGDYQGALSLDSNHPEALALKKTADIKSALASGDYETALSLDANNLEALSMKKVADIGTALASGDYTTALSLEPNHVVALILKREADIKAALDTDDYWTALFLEPSHAGALAMKKYVDIKTAFFQCDYETTLLLDPNHAGALYMKKVADDIDAALVAGDYKAILSLDANNWEALAMKKTADIKRALAAGDYKTVLSLDANNWEALAMKKVADIKAALDAGNYKSALLLDSANPDAYRCRGDAHTQQGRYKEAIKDYCKVLELNSSEIASVYANRGLCYFNLRNYDEAILDMSEAITLGVNDEDIYCFRAYAYIQLSEYGDANADYSKALEVNPNNYHACQMRASVHSNLDVEWTALSPHERQEALRLIRKDLPDPLKPMGSSASSGRGCVWIILLIVALKILATISK